VHDRPGGTTDAIGTAVSWRIGVYAGAALGGAIWGAVALSTVGAAGDQAQHDAVDGGRLLVAAAVCLGLAIVGAGVLRFGRGRAVRGIGLALLVGSWSGWLIAASLGVQHYVFGWA
jgi:hypothetical protein